MPRLHVLDRFDGLGFVPLAFEPSLDGPGIETVVLEPAHDRRGESMRDPHLTGAGRFDGGQ